MPSVARVVAAIAVAGACAAGLSACDLGAGGTKAGGESVPITLRLGTVESSDPPYRYFVEEFAREVEARSDGAVRIAPEWEANPWTPDSEALLAEQVQSGAIELALVPDRVMSSFGPSALDALHAPFLIDSMELADAVAAGDLAPALLSDLPLEDSIGLALVPEDLRHPAAFNGELVAPDDFVGLRIRVGVAQPEAAALLRALGALPQASQSLGEAQADGLIDAAETAYPFAKDMPLGSTVTANVAFFPKVNVLVASGSALDELSEEQRGILAAAAGVARDRAAAQRPTEFEGLTSFCTHSGDGVLAPADTITELIRRSAPVSAELRRHAATAKNMDEIARLKASMPAATIALPEICGPATGDSARPAGRLSALRAHRRGPSR